MKRATARSLVRWSVILVVLAFLVLSVAMIRQQRILARQKRLDQRLFAAVDAHSESMVVGALRAGADPNARIYNDPPVSLRRRLTRYARFDFQPLPASPWGTPLQAAAYYGDTRVVETLLAGGADVNGKDCSGITALDEAAKVGRPVVARLLLSHGADPNQRDVLGRTALVFAFFLHHTDPRVVRTLQGDGAHL